MNDDGTAEREELTPAEQELLGAILAGRRAEVGGQTIRAAVLRDLSIGARPEWRVPPVGISLNNAIIEGRLDLEGCAIDKPLIFLHCKFKPAQTDDTAIHLRDARVKRIALYECEVAGAIKADRAHFETAFFLTSSKVTGMVRLRGASIGEALAMDEARIENPARRQSSPTGFVSAARGFCVQPRPSEKSVSPARASAAACCGKSAG